MLVIIYLVLLTIDIHVCIEVTYFMYFIKSLKHINNGSQECV